MINKLIPAVLILAGLGCGAGAGLFLRPAEEHPKGETEEVDAQGASKPELHEGEAVPKEYVKLSNQFVVPLVEEKRVTSLLVLSLSLELSQGGADTVFQMEPKLRDGFLQLLFDHANSGGFSGSFTETDRLSTVRRGLLDVARTVLGSTVSDVLITDIIRQDS